MHGEKGPDPARGSSHSPGTVELVLLNPSGYPGVSRRELRPWLLRLLAEVAPEYDSLAVNFISDRSMRRMNFEYRGKDRTTDVLSFPGEETLEGSHLGDVVVSVPTARRQAAEAGREMSLEIRRLVLHGVLHCLGYDHEMDDGEMNRLERRLRRRWLREDGA